MCRRKGKRVLIAWSVRRPLVWLHLALSTLFGRGFAGYSFNAASRAPPPSPKHTPCLALLTVATTQCGDTCTIVWTMHHRRHTQHQHPPEAISNARAWLYARQGHASMVHLISQAQLLWHRRLFPLGHTPTTPCKRQFVHTRRDPNKVTMLPFANRGVSPSP